MKKCPFCGAEIEESARFCLYCMQSLTEKEQILPHQKKKTPWLVITSAIVITLLILVIVLLGRQLASENGMPSDDPHLDPTPLSTQAESLDTPSVTEPTHIHIYSVKNTATKYLAEEATCTALALYYYSCSCGEIGSDTFSYGVLGNHVAVQDPGHPAVCDTSGLTEGSHCSVCKVALIPQHIIPATGHTFDDDQDEICNVCNYVRVLGCDHSETVELSYLAPTCTASGLTEGRRCSVCQAIVVPQQTIPASGHTHGSYDPLTPCLVCGYYPPHTHSYSEKTIDSKYLKEPSTCLSLAVYYYSCACGEIGSETFYYGVEGNHAVVQNSGYPATCDTPGLTDGSHCSVCQEVLIEQKQIQATGHVLQASVNSLSSCVVCGEVGDVIIKAPEFPLVKSGKYQINSCTYTIRSSTQSERLTITLNVNYTNLYSVTTKEYPDAKLRFSYNGTILYSHAGSYTSPTLAPNESGVVEIVIYDVEYADKYEIVFE